MNTNQIKSGDTVKLKSGGPLMTVTRVQPSTANPSRIQAEATWFVGMEGPYTEHFDVDCLEVRGKPGGTETTTR